MSILLSVTLSAPSLEEKVGRDTAVNMLKFKVTFFLGIFSLSNAVPFKGKSEYNAETGCTLNYELIYEEKCHHEEVCHEEHEVIVTTTVVEECEDIVTKHCQSEHKKAYQTSNVVGHGTAVVGHEVGHSYVHGLHKREAAGGLHLSSRPRCKEHVEKKCHKKPIQDHHKVPHKKCHAKPICHPIEKWIPRETCITIGFSKPKRKHGH